ncbi:shikimate dehydrogenase [Merismopedia glauca]|uniref:Shikimate dehydrogenase (NADP(+)) n=1 Tax=Merismopedia glauca CCAP 1448/3 TaxID=1296344 RepID=A0A2T1BXP7_9CYAN|nr:shikimate dehydrogenase [Merismopedia glauca]PSB00789.1 shikimate dehydrogenase [Merismopedia glauca CCAP 1448/3]
MVQITGTTKLLGVIGDPIAHSLSPVIHNAAIATLDLDYVYLPFPIISANLPNAIAGFEAISLVGFSVTIPHKKAIMPLLAEIDKIATAVGAVNTVWRTSKGWRGSNTDVAGFISPLLNLHDWSQVTPVILGNGGAARAVVYGCYELGCPEIHVCGRNKQNLREFKESWARSPVSDRLIVRDWEELDTLLPQTTLLVNTTPLGMHPNEEQLPLSLEQIDRLSPQAIAYDLIYTPRPTKFLKEAQMRGLTTIDGLEMLVQQGAAALKIWLQRDTVPVDVMRSALESYLKIA